MVVGNGVVLFFCETAQELSSTIHFCSQILVTKHPVCKGWLAKKIANLFNICTEPTFNFAKVLLITLLGNRKALSQISNFKPINKWTVALLQGLARCMKKNNQRECVFVSTLFWCEIEQRIASTSTFKCWAAR